VESYGNVYRMGDKTMTNPGGPKALPLALFLMRVSIFMVFFMWTLDKFIRPDHAGRVYQSFYFMPALGAIVFYIIGAVEMLILAGFVLGLAKRLTYGAVLIFHLISTLSTFRQYLTPFENVNLLFYAAWPMLAACFAVYALRNYDTMGNLSRKHYPAASRT